MRIELRTTAVELRTPRAADGAVLWGLVRATGVLDLNSPYAYFLLGEHFAETSVIAERDGEIVGFVSGYIPQQAADTIFIWQVGVDASMRQQGLALEMLLTILRRPACQDIQRLHTTITPSNQASRALFSALANQISGTLQEQPDYFPGAWFPTEGHEAEALFTISPIRLPTTQ
jgi:L-2,4-diaminobutyric acid acetyltransferase